MSPALEAALADIDTVFDGFTSPHETGCGRCHMPEETAYLRTPSVPVPLDVLTMYVFEVSNHFADHAAAMRRLLPPWARAVADGTMEPLGWKEHGLSQVGWRSWPAEQAAAVERFLYAWWDDVLVAPEPPRPVNEVFEVCAAILGTVVPLLDRWLPGSVADAHLRYCADMWIDDLLRDELPFYWSSTAFEAVAVSELQAWLLQEAPARIEPHDHGLAARTGLLVLPEAERWDHLW
ncbi:hypothetical protein ACWD26_23300 [Streptomyces sp. NPDC002787]